MDIDSIPITLIDRVEVVTGGSSAVYGADGVSGVVNFVMKHDLEGVQARAQYGNSEDGGGEKYMGAVSVGHNFDDGKGNVTLTYEMSRQDNLFFTQRDFTSFGREAFFVPNPANPDGSIRNLPANIPVKDVEFTFSAPTGALDIALPRRGGRPARFDGFPDHLGDGEVFNPGTDLGNGSSIGSSGMPYVNDLQGDFQPTENRRIAQAMGDYDFAPWLKLSAEFRYSHVDTKALNIAPFDDDIMVRAQNAFLPTNLASLIAGTPTGEAALSEDYLAMRELELVQRDTYRFVGDASGELPSPSFLHNFRYDASYDYGQSNIDDTNLENRNIDRFAAALDSVIDPATGKPTCRSNLDPAATPPTLNDYANFYGKDANYFSDTSSLFPASDFGLTFTPGPNSGCVPFNPFDPHYNNKASIAWMTQNTHTTGMVTEEVLNGYVTADVPQFQDWGFAKPLSIVAGGEYRRETSRSTPEAVTETPGLYWYGGTLPVSGSFDVTEAFGELSLPVLADQPLAKELTVDAAGRLSDYSTAGTSQSWKLGVGLFADRRIEAARHRCACRARAEHRRVVRPQPEPLLVHQRSLRPALHRTGHAISCRELPGDRRCGAGSGQIRCGPDPDTDRPEHAHHRRRQSAADAGDRAHPYCRHRIATRLPAGLCGDGGLVPGADPQRHPGTHRPGRVERMRGPFHHRQPVLR